MLITTLQSIVQYDNLPNIKIAIQSLKNDIQTWETDEEDNLIWEENSNLITFKKSYLTEEINQILETHTLERTLYYLNRLIRSITEEKNGKFNDLNLNRWKEYEDILTDSLWVMEKRDTSGSHSAGYWGNFIPQIPNQLLRRFTKQGEWVLDTFLGSGTTLIEAKRLGRNALGIELQTAVADFAKSLIKKENINAASETQTQVIVGDSLTMNYASLLKDLGIEQVQFVMIHPPYWDIIKFSDSESDLSNAISQEDFLEKIGILIDKVYPVLEKKRHLALIISDKYVKGEWIPLAFLTMQEVLKRKFKLKATIIKNFEETKGKMNQKELWRYRALVGGFYVFKHEYIFLFQKK